MKFRELAIEQTFDWIDDANPLRNSFFEQCRKVSARKYVGLTNSREYRVGTINAAVFHVEPGAVAEIKKPQNVFLYRRGNGNEGNFPRAVMKLREEDNPFEALAALVENDFITGRKTRFYVRNNVEIDGEAEFGIQATVYEGPEGETEFGAAWITAELQPLDEDDSAHWCDEHGLGYRKDYYAFNTPRRPYRLTEYLDASALRHYRAALKSKRVR